MYMLKPHDGYLNKGYIAIFVKTVSSNWKTLLIILGKRCSFQKLVKFITERLFRDIIYHKYNTLPNEYLIRSVVIPMVWCISRKMYGFKWWPGSCLIPSHYLNQCQCIIKEVYANTVCVFRIGLAIIFQCEFPPPPPPPVLWYMK